MEIEISNIGKISSARIRLDGLTVITGPNNSGKTTLMVAMSSLLSSISNLKKTLDGRKLVVLSNWFREFINNTTIELVKSPTNEHQLLSRALRDIYFNISRVIENQYVEVKNGRNHVEILTLEFAKVIFDKILQAPITQRIHQIDDLFIYGKENSFPETDLKESFENFFSLKLKEVKSDTNFERSLLNESFENFLLPYLNTSAFSYSLRYSGLEDLEISNKDQNQDFQEIKRLHSYLGSIYDYDEANIVINRVASEYKESIITMFPEIIEKLNHIIDGKISQDEIGNIEYEDSKGKKHSLGRTAGGIQQFSKLYLLLINGLLKPNDFLFIDEPETNLHPEWQVKFGEILALLVSYNVNVVVSTHAPFFVSALRRYINEADLNYKASYYISKEREDLSNEFIDCTENIEEALEDLFAPFHRLVWF